MKFPNTCQVQKFGNIRLARLHISEYSERMERDPTSQLLADNLTRLLQERGMSALALAQRCKMGRSSVYDIIDGRSDSPKVKTVAKLAEGLGVPISDLFLTKDQLSAQNEMLRAYHDLPPAEQKRLAQVARAWRLD